MRLPIVYGVIERRILVNYRVEPDVLAPLVPPPFRLKVFRGYALAGICLIRLGVRPGFVPSWLALSSENAAHRIAVEWDTAEWDAAGGPREGVFVRRRDTSSRLNTWAGGRLFPGVQHHARFTVRETAEHFEVAMEADDGGASLAVVADLADAWQSDSIFRTLEEASAFFAAGSLGYSPASDAGRFQGMELCCDRWHVEPLAVRSVRSSLFDNAALLLPGAAQLDCALLMRGIQHQWHAREDLCCSGAQEAASGAAPAAS